MYVIGKIVSIGKCFPAENTYERPLHEKSRINMENVPKYVFRHDETTNENIFQALCSQTSESKISNFVEH